MNYANIHGQCKSVGCAVYTFVIKHDPSDSQKRIKVTVHIRGEVINKKG